MEQSSVLTLNRTGSFGGSSLLIQQCRVFRHGHDACGFAGQRDAKWCIEVTARLTKLIGPACRDANISDRLCTVLQWVQRDGFHQCWRRCDFPQYRTIAPTGFRLSMRWARLSAVFFGITNEACCDEELRVLFQSNTETVRVLEADSGRGQVPTSHRLRRICSQCSGKHGSRSAGQMQNYGSLHLLLLQ